MPNTCAFRGCHSKDGQGVGMFSFPKDPERVKLWLDACHRTDLLPKSLILHRHYKLCEFHFEKKYISSELKRKRLLPNAQPSIFPKRHVEAKDPESKKPSEDPSKKLIILLAPSDVSSLPSSTTSGVTPKALPGSVDQKGIEIKLPADGRFVKRTAGKLINFTHKFKDKTNLDINDEDKVCTIRCSSDYDEDRPLTTEDIGSDNELTLECSNSDLTLKKEMFKQFVVKIIDEISNEKDLDILQRMFAHVVPLPDNIQKNSSDL